MTPKERITTVPETLNCQDALSILEDTGQRNAPVLDESHTLFRGNIYRYHIYKHFFHHPQEDLSQISVTHFLKNTTRVIRLNDPILQLMFDIKDLPYITVLDEQNRFAGVIYHYDFREYLSQSWRIHDLAYVLKIYYQGLSKEHIRLFRMIHRRFKPDTFMEFQATSSSPAYLILTASSRVDPMQVNALLHQLKRKKYQVDLVNYRKIKSTSL